LSEAAVRKAFRDQALFCERSDAPVTAAVVRALGVTLDHSTATGRRALGWEGDPHGSADSVPLRLAGGVHALARRGDNARLSRLYSGDIRRAQEIIAEAVVRHDPELSRWLDSPPQTNETGRAAPMMAGLMLLAAEYRLPFELIELGASAGLNLNLDRFGYRLGDVAAGAPSSPVQLAPLWEGNPPPAGEVRVTARRGVDQDMVRIADPAERERLIAYCWPDQTERMERLQAALALATSFPPPLEQADAANFAERCLAAPQRDDTARVIYHTIFWTYLTPDKQERIRRAIADAGAQATLGQPLAWLRYELAGENAVAELHLQTWPGGRERHLASGHPHASSISWHG
jgi:hypothetical protein